MPAIKVENLSKSYLVGHNAAKPERYTALRDVIARNARDLARKTRNMIHGRPIIQGDEVEEFWALKDVSFEVQEGETLGIIGRNGAGKSTLLKVLSRITEPTKGRITLNGRVASLLEVGTGFHPELTGRENIFLNGAILGMTRAEIQRNFDEIVAFAEVENFLDTPVKRYSSGMYVRLAFAVAAHLEPEILVVDEVLAVGDAAFQKKCLGKMGDVAKEGRTVLFVSHNMAAVNHLCPRSVLIQDGALVLDDTTPMAIEIYLEAAKDFSRIKIDDRPDRSGSGDVRITNFYLEDAYGNRLHILHSGMTCVFVFGFHCRYPEARNISVAFGVKDMRGSSLFRNFTDESCQNFEELPTSGEFRCSMDCLPLSPGKYILGFRVCVNGIEADYIAGDAASFEVEAGDFFGTGRLSGHAPMLVHHAWSLSRL